MGIDIVSIEVGCPKCGHWIRVHRRYIETGRDTSGEIKLTCKECSRRFSVQISIDPGRD